MKKNLTIVIQNRLPEGSFIRNVLTLMSGSVFAQILLILIAPILTRLYSPEDFGVFTLYTSIVGLFAVIACLRYELAIVLPEKDQDAANVLALSVLICFGIALLLFILVAVLRNNIAVFLGAPSLSYWLWFLPISIIVTGLFHAFNYWCTRFKQFKRLVARQINNSFVTGFTQIGAGLALHPGPGGLIAGSIIGQSTATGRLIWQIYKDKGIKITAAINRKAIMLMLKRYKRFPLFLSFAGFFNSLSGQVPNLFFGYFFGATVVGYYSLGLRVVALPLSVVSNAVAQAFLPKASEAYKQGNLDIITLSICKQLFSFILVPVLLIMIAGPDLVSLVFGVSWATAGQYLIWLGPKFIFSFISSPLSGVLIILERPELNFKIDTMLVVSNTILVIIGGLFGDPLLAIKIFGLGTCLCYAIACIVILKAAEVNLIEVGGVLFKSIIKAIPYLVLPVMAVLVTDTVLSPEIAGVNSPQSDE